MRKFKTCALLLSVLCVCPSVVFGQIAYVQEFNGCSGQTCEKWQLSGGMAQISATPVLGYQPISPNNPAARGNVNKFHSVILNTTSALGISNGLPARFGFTYKCTDYHLGETSPESSIAFDVYWASSQGGPWYLLASFMNPANPLNTGLKFLCPTFTPASGTPIFIKVQATANTQLSDFVDSWLAIDDLSLDQTEEAPAAENAEQIEAHYSPKEQRILIEWATKSRHYAYFSIERATNHSDFKAIGKICGGKQPRELHSYSFVDQSSGLGKQYFYRVKMVDFYEHFRYSPVVEIRVDRSVKNLKYISEIR